jgi:chromate reductase
MFGSARAQYHLRQMMVTLNAHVLNKPEVMVASAQEKFDAQGVLTDAKTSEKVKEHLAALVEWAKRLKSH